MIEDFDIGTTAVRVGILQFSVMPKIMFGFEMYNTTKTVRDAVMAMVKLSGETN